MTLDPKIQTAIDEINKKAKKDKEIPAIRELSKSPDILVDTFNTGCISIDYLLGKGLPKGRVMEIHGAPSSGKTTLSLHLSAEVQRQGGVVAWIDAESCYEQGHADKIGVQKDKFLYVDHDSGEKLLDRINALAKAGVDLIVVDSVAALVPEKELMGEIGDQHIALQARMLSQGLRTLTDTIHKSGSTILFINQLRDNINAFGFAPKSVTPGGKAIPFYSSVRIEVKKVKDIKDPNGKSIGSILKFRTVKNKVAPPFREVELDFYYELGFDFMSELLKLGEEYGIIKKSGNTYFYGETKLGGSTQKALNYLAENEKEREEIEEGIRKIVFPKKTSENA